MLSENLKWDVAIIRNEVAMVNFIKVNIYIPTRIRSCTLLIPSAVRRRRDFLKEIKFRSIYPRLAQLVRALPLQGRSPRFESLSEDHLLGGIDMKKKILCFRN